jgi:integrase
MSFAERDSRTKKRTGRWAVDFWYKGKEGEPDRRMRGAWPDKTIADANEAYARATGQWPPGASQGAPCGPTFASVASDMRETYDVWQRGRDPSGQARLRWAEERIGHLPINQVSTVDLDGLVADLKKRPVVKGKPRSPRTINGYLTMVSAVLTWAEERHATYGNFKAPAVPWQETEETRIHFMSPEQEQLLVAHWTRKGLTREALTVRVLCASGLRWGEFEGLEPHMVQITARANGTQVGWIKLDKTKTDSPRDVPITPAIARDLKALIVNGPRPNYSRFRTQFDAAKKVLGLEPKLTIHGMRHATATRLTHGGAQPAKIQQFMGHKAYATTLKYTHVQPEALAEIAEILTPTLGGEAEIQPEAEIVRLRKA